MLKEELQKIVTPTKDFRQWYLTVDQVAEGYGVTRENIMNHLREHAPEFREGTERAEVSIANSRGEVRPKPVIYRDGVIRLGFFIRSKKAEEFRQWATEIIAEHMDKTGMEISDLFKELRSEMRQGFEEVHAIAARQGLEIDELRAMIEGILGKPDADKLQALIQEVKKAKGLDGRAIIGQLKKGLGVNTPYAKTSLPLAMNFLNNMLGRGLTTIK